MLLVLGRGCMAIGVCSEDLIYLSEARVGEYIN